MQRGCSSDFSERAAGGLGGFRRGWGVVLSRGWSVAILRGKFEIWARGVLRIEELKLGEGLKLWGMLEEMFTRVLIIRGSELS